MSDSIQMLIEAIVLVNEFNDNCNRIEVSDNERLYGLKKSIDGLWTFDIEGFVKFIRVEHLHLCFLKVDIKCIEIITQKEAFRVY
jgi:hypothetical protein